MYLCKEKAVWTDTFTCTDQLYFTSFKEPIDCKAYVSQGRVDDEPTPCCECGEDGGWDTRFYEYTPPPPQCVDKKPDFCAAAKDFCNEIPFVKDTCAYTC